MASEDLFLQMPFLLKGGHHMRQSRAFIPTMREIPTDVEMKSHQLLLRAGFLRQHASGVYSYLPFGLKVLKKIESIVHEEMEAIDAVEIKSATLQKEKLAQTYAVSVEEQAQLLDVKDHKNRQYAVGKLHKEQITSLIKEEVHSYKQLPLLFYQIMTSFQDLNRPRFGLVESRELVKKEAYSFHSSQEDLQLKYEEMKQAYRNIFTRLHLKQYELSGVTEYSNHQYYQQFITPLAEGNETIVYSSMGDFAENLERAPAPYRDDVTDETLKEVEKIQTSDQQAIKDVVSSLNLPREKFLKTLIYQVEDDFVAVLSRGDDEISETKLRRAVGSSDVALADEHMVEDLLNCEIGSVGPIQLPIEVRVIADHAIKSVVNGISGANEAGAYLMNVNAERDFTVNEYADLRYIKEGEIASDGSGPLHFTKGVEVARLSSLGTSYSEFADVNIVDASSNKMPVEIGFYEMNLSRILALLAEQHHDEHGLKWPKDLTPCDIHLIPIDLNDTDQLELATNLYKLLQSYRYEVLFDDRAERAGVKFQDADLIGLPIRVTIGKKAAEGILEVKFRETGETAEWQIGEVTEKLQAYFTMNG